MERRKNKKMFKKGDTYYTQSLYYIAWQRFKKNKLAVFGLSVISICLLMAFLGYAITPDSTPDANDQLLELSKKPPGFKVQILQSRKNEPSHHVNFFYKMLFGEVSDYSSQPISSYRFEGNDIIVQEYTGNNNRKESELKLNLANVLYPINTNTTIENNVEKGYVEFYELDNDKKIKKT